MEGLVKLSGLWTSRSGKALTGKAGGARYVVLKNNFKTEGSAEPDYHLFVGQNEPKETAEETETTDF